MTLATHSTVGAGRKKKKTTRLVPANRATAAAAVSAQVIEEIVRNDLNLAAAGLLQDMAALQAAERSQFGYKRAAKAIVGLDVSVADLVARGTLRDVPFVGPSSARIVTELISDGRSATVEEALAIQATGA